MSSPAILHGRVVRPVSTSYVSHYFCTRPHEFSFVTTDVSPLSLVCQVIKTTRSSIYLRAHYSNGDHVDTRIDIRQYPTIYVLDPLPLVFYND